MTPILSDEEVKEKISKEKIEIPALPEKWEIGIKRRYLIWEISRAGHEIMIKFFQIIGEGELSIDTWYGLDKIRAAVKDAGFILAKNKLHDGYILFKNETIKKPSFTFDPKLLDLEETELA